MSGNRKDARRRVWVAHRQWLSGERRFGVLCPWCNEEITGEDGFHAHEYLVKRSAIRKDKQHLIMVPENVVPVHPWCHENGQSPEMTRRCLRYTAHTLGADLVGEWYVKLWRDHDLPVSRGILIPPQRMRLYQGRRFVVLGWEALGQPPREGWSVPGDQWSDVRDCAFAQFAKKKLPFPLKRAPQENWALLVRCASTGYWLDYLLSVAGVSE